MKTLCLINARSGSKGVPGKNIRPLNGKPLIAYSIETALKSRLIERVIVSTDAQNIADIAKAYGAEVPFLRPPELATDTAKQIDVMIHAVTMLEQVGSRYDYICILQPTCPLRDPQDVDGALDLLVSSNADSVITITEVGGRHPRTLYTKDLDYKIKPYLESDSAGVRRQDFEDLFWRTGAVYAMKRNVLLEQRSLYGQDIRGYTVPETRSFNIDTPFDWDLTEAWIQYLTKDKPLP